MNRKEMILRWVAAGLVLAVIAGAATALVTLQSGKHITAYFSEAVGVYPNSTVRILGVDVGSVNQVTPQGKQVKVDMTVRDEVSIPQNADAVVVTPSLVADRYVQLTPVFRGGAQLPDGGTIPVAHTATPVEIDQLLSSLNGLMTALGPNGANKNGSVSKLLSTGAKDLAGNGKPLGDTIRQLGDLARTFSDSKNNLFGTVDNISKFTSMLAANDSQVNQAANQLSSITKVLADQRDDFSGALTELTKALGTVQGFIKDNRGKIQSNVDKLASVTNVLSAQKASLSEALSAAPNALTNLLGSYDPAGGTIDARGDLLEYAAAGKSTLDSAPAACVAGAQLSMPTLPAELASDCARADGMTAVDGAKAASLPKLPLPISGSLFMSTAEGAAK